MLQHKISFYKELIFVLAIEGKKRICFAFSFLD